MHAEANALLNKNLSNVAGASIYVTMFPCNECAKLLVQAGIKEVVYFEVRTGVQALKRTAAECQTCVPLFSTLRPTPLGES